MTLDGSNSTDANGDTLTYFWALTSKPVGSAAVLTGETSAKSAFVADIAGTYVASLIVNDGKVSSQAVTVAVTASPANAAPVANAGTDQTVYLEQPVTLDGSVSKDADGDLLTYSWTVKSFPAAAWYAVSSLSGATTAKPSFTPSDAGQYVFSLVVDDGHVQSAASTVTVTVLKGVGPMPAGSGLVVQNSLNFYVIDESTMTKRIDFASTGCAGNLNAVDRAPDGTLIGVNVSQLVERSMSRPELVSHEAARQGGSTLSL